MGRVRLFEYLCGRTRSCVINMMTRSVCTSRMDLSLLIGLHVIVVWD
jgi:hypothetical protein